MSTARVKFNLRKRIGEYEHEDIECELFGAEGESSSELMKEARKTCLERSTAYLKKVAAEKFQSAYSKAEVANNAIGSTFEGGTVIAVTGPSGDLRGESIVTPIPETKLVPRRPSGPLKSTEAIEAEKARIASNAQAAKGGVVK